MSTSSIVDTISMKAFHLFCIFVLFTSAGWSQRMDSIRFDKGYLFYHEYGKGEPLILLTGGPGSSYQQLEEVAVELGKSYRTILFEQRGTGRSIPTPHDATTINLQAAHDDLTLVLNHLKLKEATFIGHSWGGMLAMSYATAYPAKVKSLVLLDPGPFKLDPVLGKAFLENQESKLGLQEVALRDSLSVRIKANRASEAEKEQFEKVRLLSIVYDKSKIDSLFPRIKKGGNNLKTSGLIMKSLGESGFDLTKTLPAYKKPIHIISGRQDPGAFVSYELKVLIPTAQLYWIERAGHFPMFEQPQQFYATILGILAKNY
jgi:pimeloyl-ACP methyl ester carboxylesterase